MVQKTKKRPPSEEDELESAYRHVSGRKGKLRKSRQRSHVPVIIAICISIVAVITGFIAGYVYLSNYQTHSVMQQNVSIAGVNIKGLTQAEAIDAVQAATRNTYTQTPMTVTVLDQQVQIPCSYVGSLDVPGAVKAAYQSEEHNTAELIMDITPYLNINESGIRDVLAKFGSTYNTSLTQTTYTVRDDLTSKVLVVTIGVPEYGLDLNKLYQQVLSAYNKNTFAVIGECGTIEPDALDIESIAEEHYVAPIDAYYDKTTHEIAGGINGYTIELEKASLAIENAKYGETVEIEFSALSPNITVEDISAMLYRDVLATYTATSDSDKDRDTNLRLACEAINGLVLHPGDTFSYNETLGERTTKRGYRPGLSYAGNQTVITVGGGICQVSSALYYCTLVSEMEIVYRRNHSLMPSYVPYGLDATVSWGSIDFQFKNPLDFPIKIEATASAGETTVSIIGTETRDYRIELIYDIVSTSDYAITYQPMDASNPEGYKNGDYITKPYKGYEVDTYLRKHAKDSGVELSREFIDKSVYKKRDAVICQIIEENATENTNDATPPSNESGQTEP